MLCRVFEIFRNRKIPVIKWLPAFIFILLLVKEFPCQDRMVHQNLQERNVVLQQVQLDANNISTWIINTGIFNQDRRVSNTPGFQWPKGSGKFAIFSTGLCIGAYIGNHLREAVASWSGEYEPGFVEYASGKPIPKTDSTFRIYKVSRNEPDTSDWLKWGAMVPRGAPFEDVNHNGTYEPSIDIPGMKDAKQTVFVCLTDGFYWSHKIGEGFGGGTLPLYAELHLTAWAYDYPGFDDVQFFRWVIINRSDSAWEKTYFSIFSDCDIGEPNDDYNGCDSNLQLGYTYNSEDMDGTGQGVSYGLHPPAAGIQLLHGAYDRNFYPSISLGMTSFGYVEGTAHQVPVCEKDPNGEPLCAYNFMKGFKKDLTPWVIPRKQIPGELSMLIIRVIGGS